MKVIETKGQVDLCLFAALTKLEMTRCKPNLLVKKEELALRLKCVKVSDVMESLDEFFACEETQQVYWKIEELNVCHNYLSCISQSMVRPNPCKAV